MAINLDGIVTVLKRGAEKFYDQPNGEGPQPTEVMKRMKVDVSYGGGSEGEAAISVLDRKTGKQDHFFFKYALLLPQLIRAIEGGDVAAVRVFRSMKTFEDLPGLWKEEWKKKRCMYLGTPNATAMVLLTGLRRPVRMGWVAQKDGNAFRGGPASRLFKADLMRSRHLENGGVAYSTNGNGYEVLRHWADKNKLFSPYLQVFMPEGWEEDELARQSFNAMHGRFPVLKGANEPIAGRRVF
jgi:hypothetical protein